jgi:DNA-binding transcriptional MocR family regulator
LTISSWPASLNPIAETYILDSTKGHTSVSGTVTFDEAPPPGTINLGIGQPSADLLPVELVRQASESFFSEAHPFELNYGVLAGDQRFLESLAGYLGEGYGTTVDPETLFVTAGSSQALDFVSTVFTTSGDTVFVEEPSYFLAFQVFRDHELNLVAVPVDSDGMRIDVLEALLIENNPALIYTIPSYHNPGGHCMSAERRARLIELSQRHGFLIVADEVYQFLSYFEGPPPAFGTMIESDTVLSLGSFSKILAPAMRLGWIQTGPGLRRRLLQNGFVNSGGSINHYSSHIVRHAIDLGLQQAHVRKLKRTYRSRVEAMQDALQTHFGDLATWQRPAGGYFFWLRFDDDVRTAALRDRAGELQTGFQPGSVFSSDGRLGNFLRLSFAHYDEDDIREGIARLRPILG